MRVVELSNHPADALHLARQRREDAGRPDMADFEEAMARHELLIRRAASARDRSRAQRHWLAWLRGVVAVRKLRRMAPVPPASALTSDAEEVLRAGIAGELQVVSDFGEVLGDDWVLVRGYCNRRGEIDHLLLGPPGLVAIESKHLNATVSCDRDDWRFTRFDRYGNPVEQGALGDRRGRSPSVQLAEPAALLEEFLSARTGSTVQMLRVVLLTHPNSKIGRCLNPTVHIATSGPLLARQLDDLPPVIGAAQRARFEELIARDHRYYEQRRQQRRRPTAPATAARRRT